MSTVQMNMDQILLCIKRSIEIGKLDDALIIINNTVTQIKAHKELPPQKSIIRLITYKGPETWLDKTMGRSLPLGIKTGKTTDGEWSIQTHMVKNKEKDVKKQNGGTNK